MSMTRAPAPRAVAADSALGTLSGTSTHFAITTRRYGGDAVIIIGAARASP